MTPRPPTPAAAPAPAPSFAARERIVAHRDAMRTRLAGLQARLSELRGAAELGDEKAAAQASELCVDVDRAYSIAAEAERMLAALDARVEAQQAAARADAAAAQRRAKIANVVALADKYRDAAKAIHAAYTAGHAAVGEATKLAAQLSAAVAGNDIGAALGVDPSAIARALSWAAFELRARHRLLQLFRHQMPGSEAALKLRGLQIPSAYFCMNTTGIGITSPMAREDFLEAEMALLSELRLPYGSQQQAEEARRRQDPDGTRLQTAPDGKGFWRVVYAPREAA